MERTVLIATDNEGKIREYRALLEDVGIKAITPREIGREMEKVEEVIHELKAPYLLFH